MRFRRRSRDHLRGGVSLEQLAVLATVALGVAGTFVTLGGSIQETLVGSSDGGGTATGGGGSASAPGTPSWSGPGAATEGEWVDPYGRVIATAYEPALGASDWRGASESPGGAGSAGGFDPARGDHATSATGASSGSDPSSDDPTAGTPSALEAGSSGASTEAGGARDTSAAAAATVPASEDGARDPSGGPSAGEGDPSSEDPSAGEGDPSSDDPSAGEGDPSSDDPSAGGGDPSSDDPSAGGGDPSSDDPSAGEGDPSSDDPSAGEGDPSAGDPSADDPSTGAPSVDPPSTGAPGGGSSGSSTDPSGGGSSDPSSGTSVPGEPSSGTSAGGPRRLPVIVNETCKKGWRGIACRAAEAAKNWYNGPAARGRDWAKRQYDDWADWANGSWGPNVRKYAPWVFGWPLLGAQAAYNAFHGWAADKSQDLQNWVNKVNGNIDCPSGPIGYLCNDLKTRVDVAANVVLPFQRGVMDWGDNTLTGLADLWRLPINIATGDPDTRASVDLYLDDPVGFGGDMAKGAVGAVVDEVKETWDVCVTDPDASACAQAVGTLAPDIALSFLPGGAAFKALKKATEACRRTPACADPAPNPNPTRPRGDRTQHTVSRARALQQARDWADRHGGFPNDGRNPHYVFLDSSEEWRRNTNGDGSGPAQYQSPPGFATVVVHGTPQGFIVPDGAGGYRLVSAQELADMIRAQQVYANDVPRPIDLVSCNAGRCSRLPANVAQQLADELGVPVVGANNYVWPESGGGVATGDGSYGEWSVYIPHGAVANGGP
jgi:hypothetical protein